MLLATPQCLFNFLGLISFNPFPGKVTLKHDDKTRPFICIRVVTRGLFADLIRNNVRRNLQTCIDSGLDNFVIEVVSDRDITDLNDSQNVRLLVVPKDYRTSTGALYKARALQYALEDKVSQLNDGDYIVHLDEETLLTENVIYGILNFAKEGKYDSGQGLITYANEEVVNLITTLADCFRVADDLGKIRFQFRAFHRPLFGWKGSFIVNKYTVEKDVSFDHGPDGSIAEDCYFSMVAYKKGYKFQFIEGEMWEKSPFTVADLIKQRTRWLQGIFLVVHSRKIPIVNKFFLAVSLYAWMSVPLITCTLILGPIYPMPEIIWLNSITAFNGVVTMGMFLFGVMISFRIKRVGVSRLFVYLVGTIVILPLYVCIENIVVIWGLFSPKHKFYIVQKETKPKIDV
ncbi:Beta-1,4-mannosyltransferase egh, partial [Fragariocoptes setiger]